MNPIKKFERKHSLISFIVIIFLTILITRILTLIHDPNPLIFGYELHHFYYGIILLIITCTLLLFTKKHFEIKLSLAAISIGLILDELLFIMSKTTNPQTYVKSWPSAAIFAIVICAITLLIYKFTNEKN